MFHRVFLILWQGQAIYPSYTFLQFHSVVSRYRKGPNSASSLLLLLLLLLFTPLEFFTSVLADGLSDSKSSQVSRTLFSIPGVLSNAVIWIVSTRPPAIFQNLQAF